MSNKNNIIDLQQKRDENDPIFQAAVSFMFSSSFSSRYGTGEMTVFSIELVSPALALLVSDKPGDFEKQLRLVNRYIPPRARELRARYIDRNARKRGL
jgi:hypothetical protein